MPKLAQQHKTAITKLMLRTTAAYINSFVTNDADDADDDAGMIAYDVAYNSAALAKFVKNGNCSQLHEAIMTQDTLVREYYIDVLRYIEHNELVPVYLYACR